MIYLITKYNHAARDFARDSSIPRQEWRHVDSPKRMRGIRDVTCAYIYGADELRDIEEIRELAKGLEWKEFWS